MSYQNLDYKTFTLKVRATYATTALVIKEAGVAYDAKNFERYTRLMQYVNNKFKRL